MFRYKKQVYKHIWYISYSQRDGRYTVHAGHKQSLTVYVDKKDDNLYHIINAFQSRKERFDKAFPTAVERKSHRTLNEALNAIDVYVGRMNEALEKAEAVVSEPPKENPVSTEPPKEKSVYEQIIEALGVELDEVKYDWIKPLHHGQVIGEAIKGMFSDEEIETLVRALVLDKARLRNSMHDLFKPTCDKCDSSVDVNDDLSPHHVCASCYRVVCEENEETFHYAGEYCTECVPDDKHICPYNNELYNKNEWCDCWEECDHTDCTNRLSKELGIDEFGNAVTTYAEGTKYRCSKCAESLKPKTCGCCGKERLLIKCDACDGEGISPYDNKSCLLCEGRGTLCRECRESFEEDDDDGFERCSCGKIFFPNDGEGNYRHMQTCDGGPDDIEVDDQPLVVKTGFDLWTCLNCQDVLHKDNYADHVCKKGDDLS